MELFDYLLAKKKSGGSSGGLDWQAIGYDSTPQAIVDGYDYAVEIQENWENVADLTSKFINDKNLFIMPLVDTSGATIMKNMFNNSNLIEIPLLNTTNVTNMNGVFRLCANLKTIPLLNTQNVTDMSNMFYQCDSLTTIPILDTSSVTVFTGMLNSTLNLTDESLDNLLQMCINASSYRGTKALSKLNLNSTAYPTSRIEALTHYQDFINAGWTIGY